MAHLLQTNRSLHSLGCELVHGSEGLIAKAAENGDAPASTLPEEPYSDAAKANGEFGTIPARLPAANAAAARIGPDGAAGPESQLHERRESAVSVAHTSSIPAMASAIATARIGAEHRLPLSESASLATLAQLASHEHAARAVSDSALGHRQDAAGAIGEDSSLASLAENMNAAVAAQVMARSGGPQDRTLGSESLERKVVIQLPDIWSESYEDEPDKVFCFCFGGGGGSRGALQRT